MPHRVVTQTEEVPGQLATGLFLVNVHHSLPLDIVDPTGARHHRQTGKLRRVEIGQMSWHLHHQTLDAPVQQRADPLSDTLRRQIRHRGKCERIAQPPCLMLKSEDTPRRTEEPRSQCQHTNRVAALPPQSLGSDIRTVTKLLDRSIHPLAYIGAHIGRAVDARETVFCDTPAARATSNITTPREDRAADVCDAVIGSF